MKLAAPWLTHPGTQAVLDALESGGHNAWFVGGCVRNSLLDTVVDDIDIATDALPERVIDLCQAAGLKSIPTGIDHGTVTVVGEGKPHEITTLRRDVETDGRRATVAFSDNLLDDAQRRDFTMNALYATRDGTVLDPTGQGLPDLTARRLRFIGPPEDRIHEDYLRILRFFRFHAWYADPDAGFDRDGLAACAQLSGGIDNLARERVGAEMRKLLAAPDPAPSVATMARTGVLSRILPGADARLLPLLIAFETGIDPDPVRRLACLGGTDPTAMLRLSKTDSKALAILRDGMASATTPGALGYRYGTDRAQDIVLLRAAQFETPPKPSDLDAARTGAGARFPVTSADLMPRFTGPALGAELARLESLWINSGFTLTRAALLTDHQG